MAELQPIVPLERIEANILLVRRHKAMLDSELVLLYAIDTKALTRAVRRNLDRFPPDFMFRLNQEEFANLKRQSGTSSQWGGRRHAPYAFTEQGVKRAVLVNIQILRAFVKLCEMLATHRELARKLAELEQRIEGRDADITAIFEAIHRLMEPAVKSPKRIGFRGPDR